MSEGPSEPIEASITPDEANRIIHSHRKVRYGMMDHFPILAGWWQVKNSFMATY